MKKTLVLGLRGSVDTLRQSAPASLRSAELRVPQWPAGNPSVEMVLHAADESVLHEALAWGKEPVNGLARASRIEIVHSYSNDELARTPYLLLDLPREVPNDSCRPEFSWRIECPTCGRLAWEQNVSLTVTDRLTQAFAIAGCNALLVRKDCAEVLNKHQINVRALANRSDYLQCEGWGAFNYESDGIHQQGQDRCKNCGRFRSYGYTDLSEGELPITERTKTAICDRGWTRRGTSRGASGKALICADQAVGTLPDPPRLSASACAPHYPMSQMSSHYALAGGLWSDLERVTGTSTIPVIPLALTCMEIT